MSGLLAGHRRRILAALGVVALAWASVGPAGAASGASRARITATLPGEATAGTTVVLRGRVSGAPGDSTMDLERRAPTGGRWTVVAGSGIVRGRFAITWKPRTPSFLTIRVILVWHARTLAATKPASILIGAAPIYCATPTPPGPLPPGDGYVVGGVYNVGGPAPGITVCQGQPNTVVVANPAGQTVASVAVAASQSYTIVLPAGSYTLTAGFCRGSAKVTAGAETKADTVCPVP
jgi:hypothetical protein